MQNLFGILAIGLAVIALGVFRVPDENALVAAGIKAAAQAELYQQTHPLEVAVRGRIVTVSGRVESEAEARAVVARLRDLDGVEDVRNALTILPVVRPFVLRVERGDEGLDLTGHAPSSAVADAVADILGVPDQALPVATGTPDGDWGSVAVRAARQFVRVLDGSLTLQDRVLTLTGTVHQPSDLQAIETVLADLPEGYIANLALEAVDDGTPYRFHMRRDAYLGTRLSGKLPPDFDTAALDAFGTVEERKITRAPLPLDVPGFSEALALILPLAADLPRGSVTVAPQVASIEGGPVTAEFIARAEALAERLPEGFALGLGLVPDDSGEPWAVTLEWDGAVLSMQGRVPLDFDPEALAKRMGVEPGPVLLDRAPYRDLDGWAAPLDRAVAALRALERGHAVLGPDGLSVSGVAANPLARRLAATASGGLDLSQVSLADDGAPVAFVLDYDAGKGGLVGGKLPPGLSVADMAEALGLPSLRGRPRSGYSTGDDAEAEGEVVLHALRVLEPWLAEIDSFSLSFEAGETTLSVAVTPAVSSGALLAVLAPPMPEAVALTVTEAGPPLPGTRRTHVVLDIPQVFSAGHWLPVLDFTPSAERCASAIDKVPAIPFAAGRFVLGLGSAQPLAHLAAVARNCTRLADLTLVIEGEAASAAEPILNRQLSRRRAEAIRAALIGYRIDPDRIVARGLGQGEEDRILYRWE